MMTYWLVEVTDFAVSIKAVQMLRKWDWSCEIEGEKHCYRITSGVYNMPENGQDRAQVELMYHARNLANGAPIKWDIRGKKPAAVSKKTKEVQSKMRRMF